MDCKKGIVFATLKELLVHPNEIMMLKNNLLLALRHFWKNKVTGTINVLGLAIGISAALVIYLIIQYEYSYEEDLVHQDRIYRVVTDGEWKNSGIRAPLPRLIKNQLSGVDAVAHYFVDGFQHTIKVPNGDAKQQKLFKKERSIVFSDAAYFSIIPHQWIAGNARQALSAPLQLVLTESKLQTFFPDLSPEQAIGKTVIFKDSLYTTISGIVKDRASNTNFNNHIFISLSTITSNAGLEELFNYDSWNSINDNSQCLLLLSPTAHASNINTQINGIYEKFAKAEKEESEDTHWLQPLADIHFNKDFASGRYIEKSTLLNLSLIALFLILLGAINFINLSTAQSIERAKEIGIRKTLGSGKRTLIAQFLFETFTLTFAACIISLIIAPLLFKAFAGFVPTSMSYANLFRPDIFLFLAFLLFSISFLAGFYPAWVLTGYSPVSAIKNQVSESNKQSRSAWVRKALITSQFVVAQVFLICVLIVSKQINFAKNKDMGFRKDAIINFYIPDFTDRKNSKKTLLLNELKNVPEIEAISLGNQSPAFSGTMSNGVSYTVNDQKVESSIDSRSGDTSYLHVYNISLLAGRNVRLADSTYEVLINESMMKQMGFQQANEAIGKSVDFSGKESPIVGVVKDFNLASVRTPVKPMFYYGYKDGYVMHIALKADNPSSWKKALDQLQTTWNKVYPDYDLDYTFLDETIENFYRNDIRLSNLLNWAMGLSICIAAMGLFGLGVFTANQRTKEIGIRKVLGANVGQLVFLLLKNLLALVVLACLIAFPIAGYFMHQWLENFAFRTDMSWWIFAVSAIGMLGVAATVLAVKAFRAASANPVDSLRDE